MIYIDIYLTNCEIFVGNSHLDLNSILSKKKEIITYINLLILVIFQKYYKVKKI